MPTLLIWGAKDAFLGRELAQPSIDLCDEGHLTFIEEATHWVQHEEAARVNELIGQGATYFRISAKFVRIRVVHTELPVNAVA